MPTAARRIAPTRTVYAGRDKQTRTRRRACPPDPGIDRKAYFERCWPNAEAIESFEFVRLVEVGEEVLVTYESTKADGRRFRNTEIHSFDGDRISRVEVYFGWDVD